jgi:IS5 family transposase
MHAALTLKLFANSELTCGAVDPTVQEKAMAYPHRQQVAGYGRARLVQASNALVIELRQTNAKEGQRLRYMAGLYAHALPFNPMHKVTKRQRHIMTTPPLEVSRRMSLLGQVVHDMLGQTLEKAAPIAAKSCQRKAVDGQRTLFGWIAPDVAFFSTGKSRTSFETRVNVACP